MSELNTEQHFQNVMGLIRSRLEELGIVEQMPSPGIVRIIEDVVMSYWGDIADEDEAQQGIEIEGPGGSKLRLEVQVLRGVMNGSLPMEGQGIFYNNHIITIDTDGEILARHPDGSPCTVACRQCEDGKLFVREVDGAFYVACAKCGAYTGQHDDKYDAVIEWIKKGEK